MVVDGGFVGDDEGVRGGREKKGWRHWQNNIYIWRIAQPPIFSLLSAAIIVWERRKIKKENDPHQPFRYAVTQSSAYEKGAN